MIVRSPRPDSHFTILANEILRNQRLTLRARGLLGLLLSYPDNWRTSSENLARICPDGRDAIRTTLRELEDAGYIERRKYQDELGRWHTDTVVFDTPQKSTAISTLCPLPTPEKPTSDNQALKEELNKKRRRGESVDSYRVRSVRICGQCSGTRWKPKGKGLEPCDCDAGLTR